MSAAESNAPGLEHQGSNAGPLRELSELLGVEVTDVKHVRVTINGHPQPDPNAWQLTVTGCEWRDWLIKTRELRDAWSLNFHALRLGRSRDLPLLSKADGRRVLRLLHEVVESTTNTEGNER